MTHVHLRCRHEWRALGRRHTCTLDEGHVDLHECTCGETLEDE